jgi:hypothetical protein
MSISKLHPKYDEPHPLSISRAHVKQQELGGLVAHTLNLDLVRSLHTLNIRAITLSKHSVANLDLRTALLRLCASCHNNMREYLSWALSNNIMHDLLSRRQDRSIHAKISLQANSTFALSNPLRRLHDPHQLIRLLLVAKLLRLVVWLQTTLVRLGPNLEEVDFRVAVAVVFGVADTGAGACELDFAAFEVLEVAHAVFVLERAVDYVAEDEEFGVAVGACSCRVSNYRWNVEREGTYQNLCQPSPCPR